MNRGLISLLALPTLIVASGCSSASSDEMYIYLMDDSNQVVAGSQALIKDKNIVQLVHKTTEDSNRNPGFANRTAPQYKIVLEDEIYFLWIEDGAAVIVKDSFSEITYTVPGNEVEALKQAILGHDAAFSRQE